MVYHDEEEFNSMNYSLHGMHTLQRMICSNLCSQYEMYLMLSHKLIDQNKVISMDDEHCQTKRTNTTYNGNFVLGYACFKHVTVLCFI